MIAINQEIYSYHESSETTGLPSFYTRVMATKYTIYFLIALQHVLSEYSNEFQFVFFCFRFRLHSFGSDPVQHDLQKYIIRYSGQQ